MTFIGVLVFGLTAIGGETTGVGIRTNQGIMEVQFPTQQAARQAFLTLNGKPVVIVGTIQTFTGVEIPIRRVIVIQSITPVPTPPINSPPINPVGVRNVGVLIHPPYHHRHRR